MRKIAILLFFLFLAGVGHSQNPLYKNFTQDDGLPTSEVFYAFQDSKGYIWFCTDDGISKYNGISFENFTTNDGLAENITLSMMEDAKGNLWVASLSGKLTVYDYASNTFTPYALNNQITTELAASPMRSYGIDNDNNLWFTGSISSTQGYLWWCHEKGGIKKINMDSFIISKGKYAYFFYKEVNKNTIIYGATSPTRPNIEKDIKKQKVEIIANNTTFNTDGFYFYNSSLLHNSVQHALTVTKHKQHIITNGPQLSIITGNKEVETYNINKHYISCVFKDDENTLWLGNINGGLDLYKHGDLNKPPIHLLNSYTISSIMQDHEQGIWVTTTENGVFYYPSMKMKTLDLSPLLKEDKIVRIGGNNNSIYLGTDRGAIMTVNELFNTSTTYKTIQDKEIFQFQSNKNNLIVTSHEGFYTITPKNKVSETDLGVSFADASYIYKALYIKNTNNYLIGCNIGLLKIVADSLYKVNGITSKVSSIEKYKGDTYLLGTNTGLYIFNDVDDSYQPYNNSIGSLPIKQIIKNADGAFFIATDGYGVYILYNDTVINYSNNEGLAGNIIESLLIDEQQLLVGTSQGLSIIVFNTNNYVNGKVITLSKKYGLYNNTTVGLYKAWGKYIIVSEKGLTAIAPNTILVNTSPPRLHITGLYAGKQSLDSRIAHYELPPSQNSIQLEYIGLSYKSEQVNYNIYLEGFDEDTIKTNSTEHQYNNLKHGDYTLTLVSINDHNVKSTPIIMTFTILPHYTETWWFISLIVLGGILVISSVFLLIIRNLKRRNEIQKELLLLEQKALRAQMNPHFTFNALNSIQYFITDNNKRAATTFLSKFSKLVRNILNNSKTNTISLADEISTLTTYLELEQMRFNGKIEVDIYVDDEIIPDDIFIPSMIIQPFVENAIWHGIMPKEEGMGKLELRFEINGSSLICKVIDNGIGRERSAEIKEQTRKGHQSTGLKNIEDRIAVLNHINKTKIRLEVIDLYDDAKKPAGTLATIYFELEGE